MRKSVAALTAIALLVGGWFVVFTVGLPGASVYRVRDLWTHTDGYANGTIHAQVPAHGTEMYRLSADPPR